MRARQESWRCDSCELRDRKTLPEIHDVLPFMEQGLLDSVEHFDRKYTALENRLKSLTFCESCEPRALVERFSKTVCVFSFTATCICIRQSNCARVRRPCRAAAPVALLKSLSLNKCLPETNLLRLLFHATHLAADSHPLSRCHTGLTEKTELNRTHHDLIR